MNLGVPEKIDEYKNLPFEGIGLMRIEFIIAGLGTHPNEMIEEGLEQNYIDALAAGIGKVAAAVEPRPVVVRFSDFKTNEYRELKGGEKFEPKGEANPLMGWRGASRYVSKEFEEAFRLECKAIKKVRDIMNLDNVWVMLPFVRTILEVEKCLKMLEEEGLRRDEKFKVWLMVEVPSVVILAEQFAQLCDGFSIGSNDLTMLILGVDRDSTHMANLGYFDERNEAVLRAIKSVIEAAHKYEITVSVCGQAPSSYEDFTGFLIKNKIDSISVNPDAVEKTKKLVDAIFEKSDRVFLL
jgi:pyruvate,water dikinase